MASNITATEANIIATNSDDDFGDKKQMKREPPDKHPPNNRKKMNKKKRQMNTDILGFNVGNKVEEKEMRAISQDIFSNIKLNLNYSTN